MSNVCVRIGAEQRAGAPAGPRRAASCSGPGSRAWGARGAAAGVLLAPQRDRSGCERRGSPCPPPRPAGSPPHRTKGPTEARRRPASPGYEPAAPGLPPPLPLVAAAGGPPGETDAAQRLRQRRGKGRHKGAGGSPYPAANKAPGPGVAPPPLRGFHPGGAGAAGGGSRAPRPEGPGGLSHRRTPPRHLGPPSRLPARRSPPGPRHKAGRSRRRRPPPRTDLEPPRAPLRFWSPPSTRCSPAGRGEAPPTCSFPPAAASRRQGGKRRRSRCPEEEEEEEKQPHQGPARSAPPSMLPRAAPPAFSARRIVAPPRLRGPRCPRRPGRREERWEGPTPCRARLFHFIFFLLLFSAPLPPVGAAGLCRPLLNPSRSPAPRRAARHHSAPCRPLPAPPAEDRAPHPAASSPPSSAPCGSTARHPPRGSPPSRQVLRAYLPGGGGGGGSCLAARRRRVPSAAAKWPPRRHCPPLQPGRGRGGRDGSRGPAGPTACPPVAGEALFKINKRNSNRRPTENERIYCFCSQN